MKYQLPVGESLNETFQFALHRWPTVLRLGWAPMLMAILIAITASMLVLDFQAMRGAAENGNGMSNFSDMLRMPVPVTILFGIGVMIIISVVMSGFMASVYRLVALGEDQPGMVHIRFDGPAMRVFLAQMIISVLNYGLFFVAMLIGSMLTGISIGSAFGAITTFLELVSESAMNGTQPTPDDVGDAVKPVGLFFMALLLAAIPMIILNIRLSPFVAGSAAENRLILAGSLALTKGHFWSLLFYFFILIISLIVLGFIYQIVVGILDVLTSLPGDGAFAIIAFLAGIVALGVSLAYQVFTMALQLAASGIVYRRLKTGA